ncbi:MAG: ATP-NAD kinase [Methanoregula sp. PtaU1.Bin051]|nr:MAG: ATP-NAD kinase [Methanoregula sp. PtaU1.Bin051]
MHRIGFVVNPVAGLGGTVGLKGTDGVITEALRRGAVPSANERAISALKYIHGNDITFLTCSGLMGETALQKAGIFCFSIVYNSPVGSTTADDTRRACRLFLDEHVDLVLFCGGDGTARDVYDTVGSKVPMLGIPAGVKMYSAVFAIDPKSVAAVLENAGSLMTREAEILDIDEQSYRKGILSTRLYGIARVAALEEYVQTAKHVIEEKDEERAKNEIANFITEVMLPDTTYIIGAGTTTESIVHKLGLRKTLLGVDVVRNRLLLVNDADERALLATLNNDADSRIIVSPIGAQGFIFGRGTQQISAEVIRKVGLSNIIIVATPAKCADTPLLYVDTGDPELDAQFPDSVQVITGYRIAQRKKISK